MFLKMETQNKRTRNNNSLVRIPRLRHGPVVLSNDLILYVVLSIELLFSCSIDIVLMFPFVSKVLIFSRGDFSQRMLAEIVAM